MVTHFGPAAQMLWESRSISSLRLRHWGSVQEIGLRTRSDILTQKKTRSRYICVCMCAHTHSQIPRLRNTQTWWQSEAGTPHTECRTLGGQRGKMLGHKRQGWEVPPNGSGVPTILPHPKHLPQGPWQESSPLSAACNTSAWSLLSSSTKQCGRDSSHLAEGLDLWQASCIGPWSSYSTRAPPVKRHEEPIRTSYPLVLELGLEILMSSQLVHPL
jgi:hypothetical protein